MKPDKIIIAALSLLALTTPSVAAEKIDFPSKIGAARVSVEDTASKVGNYPQALQEIDMARAYAKKADQSYDKGRQWMGLGGLKPESEQEVLHNLQMVDLFSSLAKSRAAKGKDDEESASIDRQISTLKSRVKLLEDRKQAEDKLRQDLQRCEASTKEMVSLKTDRDKLASELQQGAAEKKKLEDQVANLTSQVNSLKNTTACTAPAQPVPVTSNVPVSPPATK